jgi:hypothetical protein
MMIWGYNEENKEMDRIDLSIDKIVAAGIDPWRLDLCDPDPVVWPLEDGCLHFRRLRDISCAYFKEGEYFIGFYDDTNATCVRGIPVFNDIVVWAVQYYKDISATDRSFTEHWREYLTQLCAAHAYGYEVFGAPTETKPVKPRVAKAVEMRGSHLVLNEFDFEEGLNNSRELSFKGWPDETVTFVGDMVESVTTQITLPDEVNAAFDLFQKWNPVVHDRTLWDVLAGKQFDSVCVSVDRDAMPDILSRFQRNLVEKDIHFPIALFDIGGIKYKVKEKVTSLAPWPLTHRFESDWHSVDELCSTMPNTVCGTRIAWFDLGNAQTRPLLKLRPGRNVINEVRFEDAGLKLLSPFPD